MSFFHIAVCDSKLYKLLIYILFIAYIFMLRWFQFSTKEMTLKYEVNEFIGVASMKIKYRLKLEWSREIVALEKHVS